jgi:tetratricopeptide (TPR) repeat protein
MNEGRQGRLQAFVQRWLVLVAIVLITLVLAPKPVPTELRTSLQQAQLALEKGSDEEAFQALSVSLRWAPNLPSLRLQAARLALDLEEPADAVHLLTGTGRTQTPETECILALAQIAVADQEQALEYLDNLPPGCPAPLERIQSLSASALALGSLERAIELTSMLMKFQPDEPRHQLQLALLHTLQAPEQAVEELRQQLDQPLAQEPLLVDLIGAIEQAAVEAEPAYTYAQIGQTFLQHRRWLEASQAFQQAVDLDPEYFEARAYLGLALERSGRAEQGLAELEQAQNQAPAAALPAFLLSRYWLQQGQAQRALELAQIASRVEPENPAYTAQLAGAVSASGDLQQAQTLYEEALQQSASQSDFQLLLAEFMIQHELDISQAGLQAARLAYLDQPSARSTDLLGYAHYLNGEYWLAQRYLARAVALDTENASAHYHYGLALIESGASEQARDHWQLALELDAEGPVATLAGRALQSLK